MDSGLTWLLLAVIVVLILGGAAVVHLIEWRLYVGCRNQAVSTEERLRIITAERDSWRTVAERALLIAEIGRNVSRRADKVLTQANKARGLSDGYRGG